MLDTRQIHPLSDFLRNHKAHVARLKATGTPEVLTVNGRAEVVVQDAEAYQVLLDRLRHVETVAAIQEGMASAERGELKSAAQVLAEIQARYGLHGDNVAQATQGIFKQYADRVRTAEELRTEAEEAIAADVRERSL